MSRHAHPDPALAAALRHIREERGITREALASRSDMTVNGLARIEHGAVAPGWGTVRSLAAGLGVSLVELGAAVEGAPRVGRSDFRRSRFFRR